MDLIGELVDHPSLGRGTIVQQKLLLNGSTYIHVTFSDGTKEFAYPSSFERFLTLLDLVIQAKVKAEIPAVAVPVIPPRQSKTNGSPQKPIRRKTIRYEHDHAANLAIKCTRNDGGASMERLGFHGVCSDSMIRENIINQKHIWCSNPDCPCSHYLKREISRNDLKDSYEIDNFLCYDSKYLRDWTVYAGYYHNGDREGQPMFFRHADVNKLCILTTRDPGMTEAQRYIFAVFLIQSVDPGNDADCGMAEADPKFRLELTPSEARKLMFWNYHANENKRDKSAWGSGLHRYLSDEEAAQILKEIAVIKRRTKDQSLAEELLRTYCAHNDLDPRTLDKPIGALQFARFL